MLIWDSKSNDTKKKLDHWFDSFEKIHLQYIIQSTETGNYIIRKESRFITGILSGGFNNNNNKNTRCYFNATIQML